jgi:hypothetical protein
MIVTGGKTKNNVQLLTRRSNSTSPQRAQESSPSVTTAKDGARSILCTHRLERQLGRHSSRARVSDRCKFCSRLAVSLLSRSLHIPAKGDALVSTDSVSCSRRTTAPATRVSAADSCAASRVLVFLPELWALIARNSGLVGAWRLKGVCRASITRGVGGVAAVGSHARTFDRTLRAHMLHRERSPRRPRWIYQCGRI